MNPVFDSFRRWARLRQGWIALVLVAALGAKLLPVAAAAAYAPDLAVHACAEAGVQVDHAAASGERGALPDRAPADCCPDGGHLCAAHCTPLILISLDLPMALPAPARIVTRPASEPTPIVHPPLLRPPRV